MRAPSWFLHSSASLCSHFDQQSCVWPVHDAPLAQQNGPLTCMAKLHYSSVTGLQSLDLCSIRCHGRATQARPLEMLLPFTWSRPTLLWTRWCPCASFGSTSHPPTSRAPDPLCECPLTAPFSHAGAPDGPACLMPTCNQEHLRCIPLMGTCV